MYPLTGIGRPLDFTYRTNRVLVYILVTAGISTAFFKWYAGDAPAEAVFRGLLAVLLLFLGWALAREIDPAHDWSAFAPLPLLLIFALYTEPQTLLPLFLLLLLTRILNRSTGYQAQVSDIILVLFIAGGLAYSGSISLLLLLAPVLFLDAYLKPGHQKQKIWGSVALAVLAAGFFFSWWRLPPEAGWETGSQGPLFLLLLSLVVLLMVNKKLQVSSDNRLHSLEPERVQAAVILLGVYSLLEGWLGGLEALAQSTPLFLVVIGPALFHIIRLLFFRRDRRAGEDQT